MQGAAVCGVLLCVVGCFEKGTAVCCCTIVCGVLLYAVCCCDAALVMQVATHVMVLAHSVC